ncbi:hypothetical protein SELMODRAFT_448213 [Selaginella moellendorffii]|uniref:Uncharacterized protein n=1 Tax=Selaginella moellendorffii TaxID=88036 RepID=D8T5M0_SELML|nr:hypothetical protein SELMODRAFT_448213 [Selaginella moellendorffii]
MYHRLGQISFFPGAMALASRHGVHALGAPSPFLHRRSGLNPLPSRNHVAIARRSSLIRAKKLESSSPSSSGKNVKQPDSSSKVAISDDKQKSGAKSSSSSNPTPAPFPNDDYFDPGMVPDFWEGPQWNWLGFILQYLWAIGIVVAVITCGILFVTYKPREADYRFREPPSLEDVKKILDERRSPGEVEEQAAPAPQIEEQASKFEEEKEPEIKEAEVVESEIVEPELSIN